MASPIPAPAQEASEAPASTTPAPLTEVHVTKTPDVCLVVSSDTKIFANVAVLCKTSEVFKLMFDARFPEGQAVINNPGRIQDIELPDDNPQDMTFLARLLHDDYDVTQLGVPQPKSIYDMSISAEKYLVCDTIRPALKSVLGWDPLVDMPASNLWRVISAAYLLSDRDLFNKASSQLLQRCSRRYRNFLPLNYDEHRGAAMAIALLLEEKRGELKCSLYSGIVHSVDEILPWKRTSGEFADHRSEFLASFDVPNGRRLGPILDSLEKYTEYREAYDVSDIVEELRDDISKGICFDCVASPESHRKHRTAN